MYTLVAYIAFASLLLDVHKSALSPSSDALFAAESTAPTTDSAWSALQKHADVLVKAAHTLSALPQAKADRHWQKLVANLRIGADAAAKAAKAHNPDKLTEANGAIVAACEACHDDYRDGGHGMTSDKRPQ